MKRTCLSLPLALLLSAPALARDPAVDRILARHEAARPSKSELAIFSLDWTPSLKAALERARKEDRPVFFIYLTNITAPASFYTGHC